MKGITNELRKTDFGYFPQDWQQKKLESVTRLIIDGTHHTPKYTSYGIPFLRVTDIQSKVIDTTNLKYISQEEHQALIQRCMPEKGDILLSKNGTIGIPKIVDWQWEFSIFVSLALLKIRKEYLIAEYLEQFFKSPLLEKQIRLRAKQGTVTNLHLEEIRELEIPVPPTLAEQEAIAGALSDADAWIESLEQLIAKKRQIKQGAMQELLTGKRRLPGFSGKWDTKRLGDHCQFLRNGTNSRAELTVEGSLKYLHYGDIHSCKGVYICPKCLPSLPRAKANTLDRLQDGDLVLADASEDTIGISKSVEIVDSFGFELVAGLHTIAVRFSEGIFAPRYAGYLQHCPDFNSHLRKLAAGTKVYATNRRHVSSAEVRIPRINEQTAIATVLSDMDTEIESLEEKLAKAREIKQGMMQELLTGRIRLV